MLRAAVYLPEGSSLGTGAGVGGNLGASARCKQQQPRRKKVCEERKGPRARWRNTCCVARSRSPVLLPALLLPVCHEEAGQQ